jgi:hypothetical protein
VSVSSPQKAHFWPCLLRVGVWQCRGVSVPLYLFAAAAVAVSASSCRGFLVCGPIAGPLGAAKKDDHRLRAKPLGSGGSGGGVWPCLPVSSPGSVGRLVIRTNVRLGPFEQIFETLVRVVFWPCLSEFPTESDRILTESQIESQPNLDRISESLSLTI